MISKSPKVSVIIPARNAANFIAATIQSLREQTFGDWEAIVLDNSSDTTASIVSSLADNRVRIFSLPLSCGLSEIRNYGVSLATAPLVAMLDADDLAEPSRLRVQYDFMLKNPSIAMVGSSARVIDVNGRLTGVSWVVDSCTEDLAATLVFRNCFIHSSIMARRSVLTEMPYDHSMVVAEDMELWTRIADKYCVANLSQALVRYRSHLESISNRRRDLMRTAIGSIFQARLAKIGLAPSAADLECHLCFSILDSTQWNASLLDIEQWIHKIVAANLISQAYPPHILLRVLAREWYRVCSISGEPRISSVRSYLRPPLRRRFGAALIDAGKLLTRSYVRRLAKCAPDK